jgi:hypothetical protein
MLSSERSSPDFSPAKMEFGWPILAAPFGKCGLPRYFLGNSPTLSLDSSHGALYSFSGSARYPCLPGMPSDGHRWSGRRLACVVALSWLWPLLSGSGWHSGDARAAREARTAPSVILFSLKKFACASIHLLKVRYAVLMLTSGRQLSLFMHTSPMRKARGEGKLDRSPEAAK